MMECFTVFHRLVCLSLASFWKYFWTPIAQHMPEMLALVTYFLWLKDVIPGVLVCSLENIR